MSDPSVRRIRLAMLLAVALLSIAAWALTWYQVRNMGLLMRLGVPMSLGMEGRADLTSFGVFTGMWAVMMVAMMLPSTYPTLLLHRTVYLKRNPNSSGATLIFAAAYFLTWTAAGAVFFLAYAAIGAFRAGAPNAEITVLRAAGAALFVAGLYQYSPFKMSCLRHCQNPLEFVMHHWRDGPIGAFRMGAAHAFYCLGCCWGLMLILFVMGVMHLAWMAAIGAVILLEKAAPAGNRIARAVGGVFVAAGLLVMIFPGLLGYFSSHVTIGR
jgi:predicted metal-binding membrane protein